MSTKQIVEDLLQKLPDDVSLHDIAREIEFVAGVRQGLSEIDRGERIRIEEIEGEVPARYPFTVSVEDDGLPVIRGSGGTITAEMVRELESLTK